MILFSGLKVNILSNRSRAVDKQNYSESEIMATDTSVRARKDPALIAWGK